LLEISAHQASPDTSTKPHLHQTTKTPKQTSKHQNTINTPISRSIQSIQTQPTHLNYTISTQIQHLCAVYKTSHKTAISQQIMLEFESFSIYKCFACRKNSPFEDIFSLEASFQQT
jgi:hypothetical protein